MAKYFDLVPEQLVVQQYMNGRTAIEQFSPEEGPIARITVNVSDEPLEEGEVAIKDYGENEGVLEDLIEHGIVDPPHRYVSSGYVTIPICNLHHDALYKN